MAEPNWRDPGVASTTVRRIVELTQAEYDALPVKDPIVLYLIVEG